MSWLKTLFLSGSIVVTLVTEAGGQPCPDEPADVVYLNGQILTMADDETASAVAIRGERIVAVGSDGPITERCVGEKTAVYDLEQRTMLPGFIDSHSHLMPFGLAATWIDVSNINPFMRFPFEPVTTNRELLLRLKEEAPKERTWPIVGAAYDPTRMKDSQITRQELDLVSEERAVLLWHSSMHAMSLNSLATRRALDLLRCQDKCSGQATRSCPPMSPPNLPVDEKLCTSLSEEGLLEEQALMSVIAELPYILGFEDPDPATLMADLAAAARRGMEIYARYGYTTGSDVTTAPLMQLWSKVMEENDAPLDMLILPVDPDNCVEMPAGVVLSDSLQIGPVKLFADGSAQGGTAWMTQPYFDESGARTDNYGASNAPVKELRAVAEKSFKKRCRLAVHTNGDKAVETMLDIVEAVQGEDTSWRPIFIHSQFATASHLERMKDLNAFPTFLAQHPNFWGDALCRITIGPGRVTNYDAAAWADEMGLNFSLHHDAFVTPPDPMRMLWASVTREVQQLPWNQDKTPPDDGSGGSCPRALGPWQRLSIERGLEAMTLGAAQQYGIDTDKGSIEAGKLADLAILDANPLSFEADPEELKRIRVLATVHRGRLWRWN